MYSLCRLWRTVLWQNGKSCLKPVWWCLFWVAAIFLLPVSATASYLSVRPSIRVWRCIIYTYLHALTYRYAVAYTIGHRLANVVLCRTQLNLKSTYVVLYRRTQARSLGLLISVVWLTCAVTVPTAYLYSTKGTALSPWTSHTGMRRTLGATTCEQPNQCWRQSAAPADQLSLCTALWLQVELQQVQTQQLEFHATPYKSGIHMHYSATSPG